MLPVGHTPSTSFYIGFIGDLQCCLWATPSEYFHIYALDFWRSVLHVFPTANTSFRIVFIEGSYAAMQCDTRTLLRTSRIHPRKCTLPRPAGVLPVNFAACGKLCPASFEAGRGGSLWTLAVSRDRIGCLYTVGLNGTRWILFLWQRTTSTSSTPTCQHIAKTFQCKFMINIRQVAQLAPCIHDVAASRLDVA